MAKSYTVDTRGVRSNLQRMHKGLPDLAEHAMIKAMGEGQRTAKQFARKKSGDLRNSIKRDVRTGKGRVTGLLTAKVLNTKGKDYARYQEIGFTHWKSGKWIEGTHYIEIGRKVAEKVYMREVDKRMKGLIK